MLIALQISIRKYSLLKLLFPKALRRYAPIALDMFWDHFLARHWTTFHDLTLAEFCQLAEQKIINETQASDVTLPERFERINGWVWQDKWLESYQKIENIEYALKRMATRSERMAPLAETGNVLKENYAESEYRIFCFICRCTKSKCTICR